MTLQAVPNEPARPAFPTAAAPREVAERVAATHPAIVLPQQLLLAQERAAWLGDELRAQIAREGVDGVVGKSYAVSVDGGPVQVGEYARVRFEQEARERDRAATLAERIARLGIDAGKLDADAVRMVVGALQTFVVEVGLSMDDEDTLHAARRAGLASRRAVGVDDGDPDRLVGTALTLRARARLLRAAADEAEQRAAAQEAAQR